MKIAALIPAFQAEPYLREIIPQTRRHLDEVIVVDDGSTDRTGAVAGENGAVVITHPANRGKGAALMSGFAYILQNGYDAVITLDADGQHKPDYIPAFIGAYSKTRADLIIGSRRHDKADMPFARRCSNFLTSRILSFLLHTGIEDSQSGFRLITAKLLKNVELKSARYQLETEIIIKAVKKGYQIGFVPIKVVYGDNFPSSISHAADTFRWVKMVLEEI